MLAYIGIVLILFFIFKTEYMQDTVSLGSIHAPLNIERPGCPGQTNHQFSYIMADQSNASTLNAIPVQEFMKQKGFVSVSRAVRANKAGYPYVTFINGANEAENIYFSKNASARYDEGEPIGRGFFDELQIAETTNAAGEARTKLVGTGTSERVNASDLF